MLCCHSSAYGVCRLLTRMHDFGSGRGGVWDGEAVGSRGGTRVVGEEPFEAGHLRSGPAVPERTGGLGEAFPSSEPHGDRPSVKGEGVDRSDVSGPIRFGGLCVCGSSHSGGQTYSGSQTSKPRQD